MFFSTKRATQRKQRIVQKVEEVTSPNRAAVKAKFLEVEAVDKQLAQVISDTKSLTSSIQDKLSTHLKITRKTLKSICQNLKEGVILVDYAGKAIEVNHSYEKMFGATREQVIGVDFTMITERLRAKKLNGENLMLTSNFFAALSKNINYRINCELDCDICTTRYCLQSIEDQFKGAFNPQTEVQIMVHPSNHEKPIKVAFSFSVLDNDPIHTEDVTYILFFKILRRAEDYNTRT